MLQKTFSLRFRCDFYIVGQGYDTVRLKPAFVLPIFSLRIMRFDMAGVKHWDRIVIIQVGKLRQNCFLTGNVSSVQGIAVLSFFTPLLQREFVF